MKQETSRQLAFKMADLFLWIGKDLSVESKIKGAEILIDNYIKQNFNSNNKKD